MDEKSINKKKHFFLTLVLTLLSLFFYNRSNGFHFIILGGMIWTIIYLETRRYASIEYSLSKLLLLSIPLSFISILNSSYGDLPLSWFNVFILVLTLSILAKGGMGNTIKLNYLSYFSFFLIILTFFPLLVANSFVDGLKQYINIATVFIAVVLANAVKSKINFQEKGNLFSYYIYGVYITGIALTIQYISMNYLVFDIGHYIMFGMNRRAYAFLFLDFSFVSLYLSSGAMMLFLYERKHFRSTFSWITIIGCLLIASMLTSARTGIASFLVAFSLYSIKELFESLNKGSVKTILLIVFNSMILTGSYLLLTQLRVGELTSDSGRMQINNMAFDVFKQYPLLGFGYGLTSYESNISTIPHNIFYQFLAQAGLLVTLFVSIFIFITSVIAIKDNKMLFWGFFSVIIGSLFIPDIFNSRFLLGIIYLISLSIDTNKELSIVGDKKNHVNTTLDDKGFKKIQV